MVNGSNSSKKGDFLTLQSLSPEILHRILDLTDRLKNRPVDVCDNQVLALVFEKPSTRTRTSFTVGFRQLGGSTLFLGRDDIQLSRGETVADTARTLSRYVDIISCRTFEHHRIEELAEHASIPIINALTDWAHPCQALSDVYTILSKSTMEHPVVAYVGDGNNVCHSLMQAAVPFSINLRIASPEGYEPDEELLRTLQDQGAAIEIFEDPADAARGAEFVYTDVWTSMGDENEAQERRQVFEPYQVNSELLDHASDSVKVVHCLPAHRGEEITDEVMDGSRSVVFDQAENRLHVQKALMAYLMADSKKIDDFLSE
ncbi:MAG: ornithine carbamoyltransferase [bacterium]